MRPERREVRLLDRPVRYFAAGNVQRGYAVATQKGCLNCHGVAGERGKPASDLANAKGLDSPAGVLAVVWNHAVVTPTIAGKKADWPTLKPEEMADLVAMLSWFERAHARAADPPPSARLSRFEDTPTPSACVSAGALVAQHGYADAAARRELLAEAE